MHGRNLLDKQFLIAEQGKRTVKAFAFGITIETCAEHNIIHLCQSLTKFRLIKAISIKTNDGRRNIIKEFNPETVLLTPLNRQFNFTARVGMISPISCNMLVIHKQTITVITTDMKFQLTVSLWHVAGCPTDRESICRKAVQRCSISPVIINRGFRTYYFRLARKSLVFKVFSFEAFHLTISISIKLMDNIFINHIIRQ